MAYERLRYNQYFIDTSEDFNGTGKIRNLIEYNVLTYDCNSIEKALGLTHKMEYAFYYDEERDVIQIHFQKTNGKADWFANIFESSEKYYDAFAFGDEMITLHVHHGWGNMYKTGKYKIREQWLAMHEAHPDSPTEVIGWSLGSGQAMLCCQDLNYNFGVRPYLYTFGSVKPFRSYGGNEELLRRYLDSICTKAYNFANVNDVITYMPPFKGFTMIHEIRIGLESRTLKRLADPYTYHTIYDHKELYQKKK